MKIFFLSLIIFHCLLSCGKENTDTSNQSGSMTATINGKSWMSGAQDGVSTAEAITTVLGVDIGAYEPNSSSTIALFVLDKKDLIVGKSMNITKFVLGGTAIDKCYASHILLSKDGNVLKTYYAVSGNLTITSVSENDVKGTFTFEGVNEDNNADKISVKNGKFDVPLN
jgi:hypothetical protein